MLNFFKGWKRKAGVVTLAIALLFAGGWIRSLCWIDVLTLNCGEHTNIISFDQDLGFGVDCGLEQKNEFTAFIDNCRNSLFRWSAYREWYVRCKSGVIVPYWSLVLPLTLLSAWLLLSKPRVAKSKPVAEN